MSFWGYRVILYTSSPVQSCTSGAIVGFSTPVHPCSHVPLELLASFRVLDPIESTVQLQLGSGGQSSRVFMFCHRRWDSGTRSLIICVCFQNHRMCWLCHVLFLEIVLSLHSSLHKAIQQASEGNASKCNTWQCQDYLGAIWTASSLLLPWLSTAVAWAGTWQLPFFLIEKTHQLVGKYSTSINIDCQTRLSYRSMEKTSQTRLYGWSTCWTDLYFYGVCVYACFILP